MTDNDVKTRPVPHQSATVQNDPFAGATASPEVAQPAHGPVPPAGVDETDRRPTMMDRIRTPVAAAVGGGILILAVGFGAGFAVGHGMGGGAASSVQNGPGGAGGAGGLGGMGGGPGGGTGQTGQGQLGQGQTGQGQTGQGQTGQGQTVPGQTGQSQTGQDGTGSTDGQSGTTDSQTGTGASTDTSFAA